MKLVIGYEAIITYLPCQLLPHFSKWIKNRLVGIEAMRMQVPNNGRGVGKSKEGNSGNRCTLTSWIAGSHESITRYVVNEAGLNSPFLVPNCTRLAFGCFRISVCFSWNPRLLRNNLSWSVPGLIDCLCLSCGENGLAGTKIPSPRFELIWRKKLGTQIFFPVNINRFFVIKWACCIW